MLARDESPLKRTPLHAVHVARGGKMVPFAGYEMPVQYPAGVLKEHLHTRSAAGLFDVSHMGQLALRPKSGKVEDAALALERLVPQDIVAVAPGRQRYAQFTNADGGLLDDLMVANFGDHLFLVVNAACKAEDEAHLRANLSETCVIEPLPDRALIALQGPKAESVLAKLCADVALMRFMDAGRRTVAGFDCFVSRSGYTGEDGFEIFAAWEDGPAIWNGLLYSSDLGGPVPCGLGARDTLRLEAGMPLYGNELARETTPFDAGLGHIVRFAKSGDFVGRRALEQASELEPHTRLYGLVIRGRGIARHGYPVYCPGAGLPCGTVTSGAPSPTLGMPIAMAYLSDLTIKPGDRLEVGIRRERVEAEAVTLPFYRREGNGNGRSR
jgi:aminomethyltransferase